MAQPRCCEFKEELLRRAMHPTLAFIRAAEADGADGHAPFRCGGQAANAQTRERLLGDNPNSRGTIRASPRVCGDAREFTVGIYSHTLLIYNYSSLHLKRTYIQPPNTSSFVPGLYIILISDNLYDTNKQYYIFLLHCPHKIKYQYQAYG